MVGRAQHTGTHIVGPGRAGRSLARALGRVGWAPPRFFGRDDDPAEIGVGADLVIIATPDDAVEAVARSVRPRAETVVVHLAGSLGLDVLRDHPRRAAVHPLVALPDESTGAQRLVGAWFAVAGDEVGRDLVAALDGHCFEVADDDRPLYHAAAVIASNHLVAVLGQAERVGAAAGVPFEALLHLVSGTIANVAALGPAAALTGPAARGDEETIRRHLDHLPADERRAYEAMAAEARRLAGRPAPG